MPTKKALDRLHRLGRILVRCSHIAGPAALIPALVVAVRWAIAGPGDSTFRVCSMLACSCVLLTSSLQAAVEVLHWYIKNADERRRAMNL